MTSDFGFWILDFGLASAGEDRGDKPRAAGIPKETYYSPLPPGEGIRGEGHPRTGSRAAGFIPAGIWFSFAGALLIAVAAPAIAAADDGDATALLADGQALTAPLQSLSPGEVSLGGDRPASLNAADVVRLDFPRKPLVVSQPSLIQLVNGDRIFAGLTSMNDEALVVLWKAFPDWPPVRIPGEMVAGVLMDVPEHAVERSQAFARVFGRGEKTDMVLLFNGDRATGELLSFDRSALKLSQGGKPLQIDMGRVRGIVFNSTLSNLPAPQKPRVGISLVDGSQLTGSMATRDPGGPLRMTAAFGATVEIPLSAIESIRFLDGRATYLSDLEPQMSRVVSYFGQKEPAPAKDRNALGGPLALRGREYAKGLGTRSQSSVTFQLDHSYRQFQSLAAIDDIAQGKGSVRFAVELDGQRAFTSPLVTGSSAPLTVGPIDVTGKERLTLTVEYGELADVDDWADWCDAVLIR
jgi:NPCBM/NEW2 domain